MKVTFPVASLASMLPTIRRSAYKGKTHNGRLDLLKHGMITCSEDAVIMRTTNLETWTVRPIHTAYVDSPGSALLPVDTAFGKVLRAHKGESVTISKDGHHLRLDFSGGSSMSVPQLHKVEEFPSEPVFKDSPKSFRIAADVFRSAAKRTPKFVSTEKTRYALNGIELHAESADAMNADPTLRMVATDGRQLHRGYMAIDTIEHNGAQIGTGGFGLIVPPVLFTQGAALFKGPDPITVTHNESRVKAETPSGYVIVRTIEGKYPNVAVIIPTDIAQLVEVDRAGLIAALDSTTPAETADCSVQAVALTFGPVQVDLAGQVKGKPTGAESSVPLVTGLAEKPLTIGVNGKRLSGALGVFTEPTVRINLVAANKAIRIHEEGSEDLHVLMPVSLK